MPFIGVGVQTDLPSLVMYRVQSTGQEVPRGVGVQVDWPSLVT